MFVAISTRFTSGYADSGADAFFELVELTSCTWGVVGVEARAVAPSSVDPRPCGERFFLQAASLMVEWLTGLRDLS